MLIWFVFFLAAFRRVPDLRRLGSRSCSSSFSCSGWRPLALHSMVEPQKASSWADYKERWAMLGLRRQTATIVALAVLIIAAIWLLT
jgi:hypothetical protein